jgi:hypothetical protein
MTPLRVMTRCADDGALRAAMTNVVQALRPSLSLAQRVIAPRSAQSFVIGGAK